MSSEKVSFLDMLISITTDGNLVTDLYTKPTDSNNYLHFTHPYHHTIPYHPSNHKGLDNVEIHILDFIHAHPQGEKSRYLRDLIEFNWLQRLHTNAPMGLNVMDPFWVPGGTFPQSFSPWIGQQSHFSYSTMNTFPINHTFVHFGYFGCVNLPPRGLRDLHPHQPNPQGMGPFNFQL